MLPEPKPQFDVVVTMEQSRLGKDIAKTLDLIATIEAAGVEVWSYSDARQVSVEEELDEMNASMKAIVDKAESRRASVRTSAGLAAKAQKGHVVGSVPFGYTGERVGDHTEFRINEAERAVVVRIFTLFAEGHGMLRIANILNRKGVAAPGCLRKGAGKDRATAKLTPWSKQTIKAVLRRMIYAGRLTFGTTKSKGKRKGIAVKNAKPLVTPVEHLRLVEPAPRAQVQARHDEAKGTFIRQSDGRLLSTPEGGIMAARMLNSIARCHVCGGPMVYWNRGNKSAPRYYCSARLRRGPKACESTGGVPAVSLDLAVHAKLHDMLNDNFDAVLDPCRQQDTVWKEQRAAEAAKDDRAAMENEAARLEGIIVA